MARQQTRNNDWLHRVEVLLWTVAGLCTLLLCFYVLERTSSALAAGRTFPSTPSRHQRLDVAGWRRPEQGEVLGRLVIPALRLSVPIIMGVEPMSLVRGVGHIPGTALPGGLGTVGLAGHRDTYLRALRQVTTGMDIELIDQTGLYHYTVTHTEIVTPDQVRVLNVQATPQLTLITCYPFDYVGPAPRRFIVFAALDSVIPDGRG